MRIRGNGKMADHRLIRAMAMAVAGERDDPLVPYRLLQRTLAAHLRRCRQQHTQRRLARRLDRCIQALPGDCREAVVLCILEAQSVPAAAQRLAWPVARVRSALRNGLIQLCRLLGDQGVGASPSAVTRLLRRDVRTVALPAVAGRDPTTRLSTQAAQLAADYLRTSAR